MKSLALAVKLAVVITLSVLVVACSSGDSSGGDGATPPINNTPSQLITALIRQSDVSETVSDYWRCYDSDYGVSYLAIGYYENGQEALSFESTATEAERRIVYEWQVSGNDALQLSTKSGQLSERFSYIGFSTARSLSMVSSTRGYLSCTYHPIQEIESLNMHEVSPGQLLESVPMLPVVPPAGFSSFRTYIKDVLFPFDGTLRPTRAVDALFDNGEIPISINTVFKLGPDSFARDFYYELEGDRLYVNSQTSNVKEGGLSYPSSALTIGSTDERISGCYTRGSSFIVDDLGATILTSSSVRWCFTVDGQFTIQNGESTQAIFANTFVPSPATTGRYRIDGYAIRLQFNNGFQIKTGFGWFDRAAREVYLLDHYPTLE